jgi:Ca2+-binding RTX toxin-like protein
VSLDGVNFFKSIGVTFNDGNWDVEQTVHVRAIDDDIVDGGDTQVFAPILDLANNIQGPLFIVGGIGVDRSGLFEREPVMLPGEVNLKDSLGVVLAATEATADVPATITIDPNDPDLLSFLGAAEADDIDLDALNNVALEITRGEGKNKVRLIEDAEFDQAGNLLLTLNKAWDNPLTPPGVPGSSSQYTLFNANPNLLVNEAEQVDFLFFNDSDNVNSFDDPALAPGATNAFAEGRMFFDDENKFGAEGREEFLNRFRIVGFGMGGDRTIGAGGLRASLQPGGITYEELEVVEVNLGPGNNKLQVDDTVSRVDGFQTWTTVNTGDGDDVVIVDLEVESLTLTGAVAAATQNTVELGALDAGTAPQDDSLVGQFITVVDAGGNVQTRQIASNTGNTVRIEGIWTNVPGESFSFEIFDASDGGFALDARGGNDTVDGSASSLPLVIFGGDGDDTIYGGSGEDIIFGDRGVVDFVDEAGMIVTRLGTAPEPIIGDVISAGNTADGATLTFGGVFPVPNPETGDPGLAGLVVSINSGKGLGQSRLIVDNDAATLTLDRPWDEGGIPDHTSSFRISTVPEDQTDGVAREPTLVRTLDPEIGGVDTIFTGEGRDIVFGGRDGDILNAQGLGAAADIIVGDQGQAEFSQDGFLQFISTNDPATGAADIITGGPGANIILGGAGGDHITAGGDDSPDIILGDNGSVTFTAVGDHARLVTTNSPEDGGSDTIIAGDGPNILVGGSRGDTIHGGKVRDIVIGDNGVIVFTPVDEEGNVVEPDDPTVAATVLATIESTVTFRPEKRDDDGVVITEYHADEGGDDDIFVGEGDDVVIGGVGSDFINWLRNGSVNEPLPGAPDGGRVADDSGRDIIVGDNGKAVFQFGTLMLEFIETTDNDDNTDPDGDYRDWIFAANGPDVVLGGNGDDVIDAGINLAGLTDFARDIVLGDNGRAEYDDQEVLIHIFTTQPHLGGNDDIVAGDGDDVAMGGIGSDFINWIRNAGPDAENGGRIAGDTGKDVVIGDNGEAWFDNVGGESQIREITTTDPEHGDDDHIFAAEGQDVVFGGSGGDVIDAGTDPNDLNPDIVIGDNGRATFNGNQTPTAEEASSVLSFNFNGKNDDAIVTGVAGAAPAGNWNNLKDDGPRTYGDDAGELLYFDDGKIAPGITLEWGADLDSTQHGDPDDLHEESHSQIDSRSTSTQDQRLFEGYLSSNTNDTVGVNIAGLGGHFSTYDVYVYLDLDDSDSRSGSSVRSISDGSTKFYLDDPDGNTFTGTFFEVVSEDPNAPQAGNYVVFRDLSSDSVKLRIDDVGTSSSNKPGITAVQVVGTHHPIDRIETIHTAYGGVDHITTGSGPDIVFGGELGDTIITHGNSIYGEFDADIVAGDNARATFMVHAPVAAPAAGGNPLFVLGELREISTTDFEAAGTPGALDGDMIFTGNGQDVVIGGNGGDFIDTGAAAGSYDYGAIDVVSINFNSDVAKGSITGVAGAVAVDGWHNLEGGKGSALLDGIQVQWGEEKSSKYGTSLSSSADTDSHDEIHPDTQNERLFEGYLEKDDRKLGVDLSGLGGLGTYDVYVYLDSDQADHDKDDPAVVKVSAGGISYFVNDPKGNTFDGTFVNASAEDPDAPGRGNYVVFSGLDLAQLSIRISGDETLGRHADGRPSIAAIQIVSGAGREHVVLTGDTDEDRVVGDNAVVRWFGGQVYEIVATDLQPNGSLSDYQSDTITLGDGADIAIGGNGGDDLTGGEGDDLLLGDNARILLFKGEVIGLEPGASTDWHHDHDHDDDHGHHDWNPFDVLGIELLGEAIGGNDILEGGQDDDLIYGQFGNDTYVFAGGGLGQDFLVEAGIDHHHDHDDHDHDDDDHDHHDHHHPHHHDHGLNDLHDMLDFSQFDGAIDINLDQSSRQTINGYRTDGDVNLKLVMFHGDAFEDVIGSRYSDRIDGNDRNNVLVGLAGNDDIEGDSGDDVLLGNDGDDELDGGSGNDLLDGGDGDDELDGGDPGYGGHHHGWKHYGGDILLGGNGNDKLKGGKGDDLLDGGAGDDELDGDSGNDILLGGDGNDELDGDSGDDQLFGGAGDDELDGGSGKDVLTGGDGKDELDGGSDADVINRDAADKVKSDKKDKIFTASPAPDLDAFFVAFNDMFRSGDACGGAGPSIDWQGGTSGSWRVALSPYTPAKPEQALSPNLAEFDAKPL